MSKIGEKAEKIWMEKSAIITQRKKELTVAKTYANRVLDIFGALDEQCCVTTVIVSYDSNQNCLNCCVQLLDDIYYERSNQFYNSVIYSKVMEAMKNVNVCNTADFIIITDMYNILVADPQVTKYFEVTLDAYSEIVIKMRTEKDVTLNETICEKEES